MARHGDFRLDCLLSAELARAYKTSPEVYLMAAREPLEARVEGKAEARPARVVAPAPSLPDEGALRLPVDVVARTFLFLSMSASRNGDEISHADLVDLFLHGALSSDQSG